MPLSVFRDHFNNVPYMRPGQRSGGGRRETERKEGREGRKEGKNSLKLRIGLFQKNQTNK